MGFRLIISSRIFGIFSIIFAYEVIIVIVDYLAAVYVSTKDVRGLLMFYGSYYLSMHSTGLVIALFGTAPIQRFLGIRLSLLVSPICSIVVLAAMFIFPTTSVIFFSLVILRALNYGLNHPAKEALFIPTTKAIKYKTKAWTDAFGSRISKASGSLLNKHLLFGVARKSALCNLLITPIWLIIAFLLGKEYRNAIQNNKVIGAENTTE